MGSCDRLGVALRVFGRLRGYVGARGMCQMCWPWEWHGVVWDVGVIGMATEGLFATIGNSVLCLCILITGEA